MNSKGNVDAAVLAAAKKFEEAMSTKPIEEQIAVGLISKNVLNGCSWEFVRANPEIRDHLTEFKNSKVCSAQKVVYNHKEGIYGYLVYMQMSHLCKLLGPGNKGPINDADLQLATKHREEAIQSVVKKMKSGYSGKIGIYCTNDSQAITVSGNTYPAFAITLKELCTVCKQYGYGVMVSGAVRDPMQVLAREDAVLASLTVAPSSNALFINIAPMR